MIKRRRFPKIFFGWWTVLAGGILAMWGNGYYISGFSAFFKPIASELGFSRAVTSIPASFGKFEGGFEAPLSGWLTDRYGPRWIVLLGVFLMGLGLILMNFINSFWTFLVAWGVLLGTGINMGLSLPLEKAVTNWFVKKRGLAISIRWTLSVLGSVLVLPLIGWLISMQGWRVTGVIGGVVMLLVGLPLAWFFVKQHRPEYYGLLPDGATVEEGAAEAGQMIDRGVRYAAEVQEVEFTVRQAVRTPTYWLLVLGYGGYALVSSVVFIHGIPFLTDMGIDPVWAAVMMGISSSASLPTRLLTGFFADRLKKSHLRFLMGGAFLLQALGVTVFLLNQTIPMAYVFFILYWAGMGPIIPLNSIIRSRYFGRKAFGSIQGTSTLLLMPTGVIAPIYAGWVYDTTGRYVTVFVLMAALLAFAALVMSLASPPRPPAKVTDIRKIV